MIESSVIESSVDESNADEEAGAFDPDSESPLPTPSRSRPNGTDVSQGENPTDADYRIFESLNYGPEQQAVYSREMAQGAAACCPKGCCEGRVRRQPIDKLLEMEDATISRLQNAQYELQVRDKLQQTMFVFTKLMIRTYFSC